MQVFGIKKQIVSDETIKIQSYEIIKVEYHTYLDEKHRIPNGMHHVQFERCVILYIYI